MTEGVTSSREAVRTSRSSRVHRAIVPAVSRVESRLEKSLERGLDILDRDAHQQYRPTSPSFLPPLHIPLRPGEHEGTPYGTS